MYLSGGRGMNGDQGRCFGEMENRVAEDKIVAEFVGKKKSRKKAEKSELQNQGGVCRSDMV